MTLLDRFRRLHGYEMNANRLVFESLRTIDVAGTAMSLASSQGYERALGILAHIQWARRIWLERIRGASPVAGEGPFPVWTPEKTEAVAAGLDREWGQLLEGLREDELVREVVYRSMEGVEFVSALADIVTHVFNHSTYHRGQIAPLVRVCGGTPAVTDYIVGARRRRD
jgi:uncharacterized damage-inducible protein DinB